MKNFSLGLFLTVFSLTLSAQCTIACFSLVTGNLDASCQYELTLADAGSFNCPGGVYQIDIFDDQSNLIPTSPIVDGSYLGMNLSFTVTELNSNTSCFGNLIIDDNVGPTVICNNVDVECFENNVVLPTVFDNCSVNPSIALVNQSIIDLPCDPDYVSQILNTFEVSDDFGNKTTCFANVNIKRVDLNNITMPSDLSVVNSTELDCGDSDGPSSTGYPQFNNIDLNNIDPSCNLSVSYSDNILPPQGCLQRIVRTWTIEEFWCGSILQVQGIQVIEKVDSTPPNAICNSSLSASLDPSGNLVLLPSDLDAGSFDDCSSSLTFVVNPDTFTCADIGTTIIQLIVYDECSNSTTCTTSLNILDPLNVCPPPALLILTAPITNDEDFCAGADIESDACLKPNVNVSFTAPISILLESGFEVPANSNFDAIIDECGNQ